MDVHEVVEEVIALRTEITRRPCTAIKVIDHGHSHYIIGEVYNNADLEDFLLQETAAG